ncbi:MAG: heparan N-sulfatase, partial [Pirellulales bacterium]|nr:heparan N-sulfatase [Pirellulales bacterium]
PDRMPGYNLLPSLSGQPGQSSPRQAVFSGRERHSSSRFRTLGYPCRCVRTKDFLYIRNFTPERWPAGASEKYDRPAYNDQGQLVAGKLTHKKGQYHDIDDGPTLKWMINHQQEDGAGQLLAAAVDLRPAEELFDIRSDPGCLNNLADFPDHADTKSRLSKLLSDYLRKTGDLRQIDPQEADVWETYPRVSSLRWFPEPEWARKDPASVPQQDWLEERRPRK